jgi:hypothetical protein
MTQEEKELLLELLQKANCEDCLRVYTTEQEYELEWCFIDNDKLCIRIEEL